MLVPLCITLLIAAAVIFGTGPSTEGEKWLVAKPQLTQGYGHTVIHWRSHRPYHGEIVYGIVGDKLRERQVEKKATVEHAMRLTPIVPDESYGYRLVYPDGSRSLERRFVAPPALPPTLSSKSIRLRGLDSLRIAFTTQRPCTARIEIPRFGRRLSLTVSAKAVRNHEVILERIGLDEKLEGMTAILTAGRATTRIQLPVAEGPLAASRRIIASIDALDPKARAHEIRELLRSKKSVYALGLAEALRGTALFRDLKSFDGVARIFFRSPTIPVVKGRQALYHALVRLEAVEAAFWSDRIHTALSIARHYEGFVKLSYPDDWREGTLLFDGERTRRALKARDPGLRLIDRLSPPGYANTQSVDEVVVTARLPPSKLQQAKNAHLAVSVTNLDPQSLLRIRFDSGALLYLRHNAASFRGLVQGKALGNPATGTKARVAPIVASFPANLLRPGENRMTLSVENAPGLAGLAYRYQLLWIRLAVE